MGEAVEGVEWGAGGRKGGVRIGLCIGGGCGVRFLFFVVSRLFHCLFLDINANYNHKP